jgi:hypothetical protein
VIQQFDADWSHAETNVRLMGLLFEFDHPIDLLKDYSVENGVLIPTIVSQTLAYKWLQQLVPRIRTRRRHTYMYLC